MENLKIPNHVILNRKQQWNNLMKYLKCVPDSDDGICVNDVITQLESEEHLVRKQRSHIKDRKSKSYVSFGEKPANDSVENKENRSINTSLNEEYSIVLVNKTRGRPKRIDISKPSENITSVVTSDLKTAVVSPFKVNVMPSNSEDFNITIDVTVMKNLVFKNAIRWYAMRFPEIRKSCFDLTNLDRNVFEIILKLKYFQVYALKEQSAKLIEQLKQTLEISSVPNILLVHTSQQALYFWEIYKKFEENESSSLKRNIM